MQTLPHSLCYKAVFRRDILNTASAQKQPDTAAILSALQPFVPTDPSSMADMACLNFYNGSYMLDEYNNVLEMFPHDASYARILQDEDV